MNRNMLEQLLYFNVFLLTLQFIQLCAIVEQLKYLTNRYIALEVHCSESQLHMLLHYILTLLQTPVTV